MTRSPASLRFCARALLVLLPLGHLLALDAFGAVATGTDVLVFLVVVVWAARGMGRRGDVEAPPSYTAGIRILVLFGLYVGLTGLWGFHPAYALAKGAAAVGLALVAAALARSGLAWRRAVDAWLLGTGAALVLTVVLVLAGLDLFDNPMLYEGGGVLGLPLPRLSGPMLHPNMLGDYLVVSGILLWGRWPTLQGWERRGAELLAVAIGLALFLSASSAWVSAGVAVGVVAWWSDEPGRRGHRALRTALAAAGGLLALVTAAGLVARLTVELPTTTILTGGIRPAIWADAARAFMEAPLLGVGAAPFLADVADPFRGSAPLLWDAHNAYLSILGQFGLVGAGLFGVGAWLAVRGAVRGVADRRVRAALALAFLAVAIDALFLASEDLRHVWILLGVAGVAALEGGGDAAEPAR